MLGTPEVKWSGNSLVFSSMPGTFWAKGCYELEKIQQLKSNEFLQIIKSILGTSSAAMATT